MNIDLTGKRVLVCGASRGIGKAIAIQMANAGASITALARNADALSTLLSTLSTQNGQRHDTISADIGSDEVLSLVEKSVEKVGDIHIVVNNTAGPAGGLLSQTPSTSLVQAFSDHVLASHNLMSLLVPSMKASRYGRVINIISTSVKQPISGLGVSNTVRGAMASWSKTLATELAPLGITVNNILPGATETDRLLEIIDAKASSGVATEEEVRRSMLNEIPMGRFASPNEIAFAAVFLASDQAGYITGTSILVDGGRTRAL